MLEELISDFKDCDLAMETKTRHNGRLNVACRCCFTDTLQMDAVMNELVKEGC